MNISFYTYGWDLIKGKFDYKNALDNYALYADEIIVNINTSTDGSYEAVSSYVKERGYNVKVLSSSFDPVNDPFFYGRVVNAALQGCSHEVRIAQDFDERWCGNRDVLRDVAKALSQSNAKALFIPTIDLYGDINRFASVNRKWYMTLRGVHRGPVNFGIKADGRPDYNKTSCDEAVTEHGDLVPTIPLINDLSIENLRGYASQGLPYSMHLGFTDLRDRAERAVWWGDFWRRATGGDPNGHITDVNELLKRATQPHHLPLWQPQP